MRAVPLTMSLLPRCTWQGPLHLNYVWTQFDRVAAGDVELWAVVDDQGEPVSMGGVDFVTFAEATLWMLSTIEHRRGQGFGTVLIEALERAARSHGHHAVSLHVEVDNPRAEALYARLGYAPTGEIEHESWLELDAQGEIHVRQAECRVMRKALC